jgi:hypothetical protein
MKLKIAQKLILIVLGITAGVIVIVVMAMRHSIDAVCAKYIAQSELSEISILERMLEHAHAMHGDWNFVREDPGGTRQSPISES